MEQSPIDQSHELLKAQFKASCQRVKRKVVAHSNKTRMLEEVLDVEEEKGNDSRLFRLTQKLDRTRINGEEETHIKETKEKTAS